MFKYCKPANPPVAVHSLVRRHAETHDLIVLADEKNRHPHEMQRSVQHHPSDPRRTASNYQQRCPQAVLVANIAHFFVIFNASEKHPHAHRHQHHEEADEELVVFGADTISDPRTMMIEASDAFITHAAVLRSHWPSNETG